jgi:hypothetical protein
VCYRLRKFLLIRFKLTLEIVKNTNVKFNRFPPLKPCANENFPYPLVILSLAGLTEGLLKNITRLNLNEIRLN